jgi:hypothetical protein
VTRSAVRAEQEALQRIVHIPRTILKGHLSNGPGGVCINGLTVETWATTTKHDFRHLFGFCSISNAWFLVQALTSPECSALIFGEAPGVGLGSSVTS